MSRSPKYTLLGRTLAGWLGWELANQSDKPGNWSEYGRIWSGYTQFSSRLIKHFDAAFLGFDADVLEELYLNIAETTPTKSQARVARFAKSFHIYLMRHFGVDAINFLDLDLLARNNADSSSVDNHQISPLGRQSAVLYLESRSLNQQQLQSDSAEDVRFIRLLHLLVLLMIGSGARIGELLGTEYRDLSLVGTSIYITIRRTGLRGVKTRSGRRMVDLARNLDSAQLKDIKDWFSSAQQTGLLQKSRDLVFADLLGKPVNKAQVYQTLRTVYNHLSLNSNRNHHFRHARAGDDFPKLLTGMDLHTLLTYQANDSIEVLVLYPRDLFAITRPIGHKLPRTTLRCYFHLAWLFSLAALHKVQFKPTQAALAYFLCISQPAASRRLSISFGQAMSAACRSLLEGEPKPQPQPAAAVKSDVPLAKLLNARIAGFIDATASGAKLSQAAKQYGVREDEIKIVLRKGRLLEKKTGIRVLPDIEGLNRSTRPRAFQEARAMRRLWAILENASPESQLVRALAQDWFTYDTNRDEQSIGLTGEGWRSLKHLLDQDYIVSPEGPIDSDELVECSVTASSTQTSRRSLNRNLRWVLAVAWVTYQVLDVTHSR
jgi:integrase